MTQPPSYPEYNSPSTTAPKSRMAITSMVLGIVALPLMCAFGVGLTPAIIAVILGFMAMGAIGKSMGALSGRGFALTGVILGIVCLVLIIPAALMMAIMLPSLGKARELANRSVCAANLRGTSQSMNVYAADNSDAYPIIAPIGAYSLASGGSGTPSSTADATINSMYMSPAASVTQNMWLLVLTGQ